MKSVTKTNLSTSDIERIFAHNFDGAKVDGITELKGGMFNTAYIVKSSVRDLVLKVGPLPSTFTLTYETDIMKTETEVSKKLESAGVPVPKIIATDFTRDIIPCDYFIMELARGKTWNKTDKQQLRAAKPTLMRQFGEYTAKTHSVIGDWFGYIKDDKRFRFDNWYDAFSAMVSDILSDGKKLNRKLPYDKITATVADNKQYLNEVEEPRLVNFDMWAGNVFIENGEITAIVDLERAFYGDPYADFTSTMLIFSDIEKEPEFRQGYESVTENKLTISIGEHRRMNLYRLYMALIMNTETYRYNNLYAAMVRGYTKNKINHLLKRLSTQ